MKIWMLATCCLVALCVAGCEGQSDQGSVSDSTATNPAANQSDAGEVDVDVEGSGSSIDDRAERRQERRENLREAIDGAEVSVDANGVDVDIN